jgi:hypothetical protein
VDAVGEAKEAGRAGTVGGAVLEDDVGPALEAGGAGAGAGVEVTAAGVREVDVIAAAAMVPLRSHGFGGEAIVQIGGLRVHRNTQTESGFSDKIFAERAEQPIERFGGQTDRQTDLKRQEWG